MIIVKDFIREDGVVLKKVYSNKNVCIRKKRTGQIYEEAINLNITADMYEETDIEIESHDENLEQHEEYSGEPIP